jgi:uncharacterized membrane protein YcjF (UPF0283 family)
MMRNIWKTLKTIFVVTGSVLTFFAVIEVIRAYEVLYALNPWLGTAFAWLLLLGAVALLIAYVASVGKRPGALIAPAGIDPRSAEGRDLHRYARFQSRLMRRLGSNALLPEPARISLLEQERQIRDAMRSGNDIRLSEHLCAADDNSLQPLIAQLDAEAHREVERCVRDVMLAVTLSPWRSVDLLVVLYRNLCMVTRLTAIYDTRPGMREQLLILRDVFTIVATINFLNYGSSLLQNLTASVPLLGRFADDVAQGIGAGLLTSVAGHAAVERCRAYRGWDAEAAEQSVRSQLKHFMDDVKNIVTTDVLQRIRKPVEAQYADEERPADLFTRIRDGISTAIDETSAVMDTFIVRPVAVAGRGVAGTGAALGKAVVYGGSATLQGTATGIAATGRWIGRTTMGCGRLMGQAVMGTARMTGRGARAALRPFTPKSSSNTPETGSEEKDESEV